MCNKLNDCVGWIETKDKNIRFINSQKESNIIILNDSYKCYKKETTKKFPELKDFSIDEQCEEVIFLQNTEWENMNDSNIVAEDCKNINNCCGIVYNKITNKYRYYRQKGFEIDNVYKLKKPKNVIHVTVSVLGGCF